MPESESATEFEALQTAWRCVPLQYFGIGWPPSKSDSNTLIHLQRPLKQKKKDVQLHWLNPARERRKTNDEALFNEFIIGLVQWAVWIQTEETFELASLANEVITDSRYWAFYLEVYLKLADGSNGMKCVQKLLPDSCRTIFTRVASEGVSVSYESVLRTEPIFEEETVGLIKVIMENALETRQSTRQPKPKHMGYDASFYLSLRLKSRREFAKEIKSEERKSLAKSKQRANADDSVLTARSSTSASLGGSQPPTKNKRKSMADKSESYALEETPSGETVDDSHRQDSSGSNFVTSKRKKMRAQSVRDIHDDTAGNAAHTDQENNVSKAGKKQKRRIQAPSERALSGKIDKRNPSVKINKGGKKRSRDAQEDSTSTIVNTKAKRSLHSVSGGADPGSRCGDAKLLNPNTMQVAPDAISRTSSNQGSEIASVASSATLVGSGSCAQQTVEKGLNQDALLQDSVDEISSQPFPLPEIPTARPQSGRVVRLENQELWRKVLAMYDPNLTYWESWLTSRSPQHASERGPAVKKLLPEGAQPHIWASSRQAVCETTTFFRSYHGGVYQHQGKAEGYLLGGFSSERDQCAHDGRLIISHGGGSGGRTLDETSGQAEDDKTVRALKNAFRTRLPIALLADDQYALFPYQFAPQWVYVVLGFYTVVAAWEERDVDEIDGVICGRTKYKFAFQYCERKDPWWAPAASTAQPCPAGTFQSDSDSKCPECEKESPRVYEERWLCLNSKCRKFFDVPPEEYPTLKMCSNFLALRDIEKRKCRYRYQFEDSDKENKERLRYTARGLRCDGCGQMCPREYWEKWWCSWCERPIPMANEKELPIFRPHEFSCTHIQAYKNPYKFSTESGIKYENGKWEQPGPQQMPGGTHLKFILPEGRGIVHLVQSQYPTCQQANKIFEAYQKEARDKSFLRRYPLQSHQARGQFLSNYFSHNAGVPYKYIVSTNATVPFDKAPQCVNDALGLIKERASIVLKREVDFNEILTAAYMERQSMSYHTDDEKGLGPTVASLSLGSAALMHFRLRKKVFREQQEKEKAAAQALDDGSAAKPEEQANDSKQKERVNSDKHLTIVLRHGDVLIMDGAKIQELYEHTVEPFNFRIAATARMIDINQS